MAKVTAGTTGADGVVIIADSTTEAVLEVRLQNDAHNRFEVLGDGTVKYGGGGAGPAIVTPSTLVPVATGMSNMPRVLANTNSVSIGASQSMRLTSLVSDRSMLVTNIVYRTGGTPAGATPSLIKYALFSVAANGDITKLGVTANNTGLLVAANTEYPQALLTPVEIYPGQLLMTAILVVTAAGLPTFQGITFTGQALIAKAPRQAAAVSSQADIPDFVAAGSVGDSLSAMYVELT